MEEHMEVLAEVGKEVAAEAYSDGVSQALREVGKIGADAVKTIRLALFPLQFAGALQDRLAGYIERAVRSVPPERRIAPVESLTLQITDRLRVQEQGSPITEMYLQLLARAMDRERTGEAHPAFVQLIGQLSADEALMIERLSVHDMVPFVVDLDGLPILEPDRDKILAQMEEAATEKGRQPTLFLRAEDFSSPDLLYTYIEHLCTMGLVGFTNDHDFNGFQERLRARHIGCWFLKLNRFGRLFHTACSGVSV